MEDELAGFTIVGFESDPDESLKIQISIEPVATGKVAKYLNMTVDQVVRGEHDISTDDVLNLGQLISDAVDCDAIDYFAGLNQLGPNFRDETWESWIFEIPENCFADAMAELIERRASFHTLNNNKGICTLSASLLNDKMLTFRSWLDETSGGKGKITPRGP